MSSKYSLMLPVHHLMTISAKRSSLPDFSLTSCVAPRTLSTSLCSQVAVPVDACAGLANPAGVKALMVPVHRNPVHRNRSSCFSPLRGSKEYEEEKANGERAHASIRVIPML